jgi:hypothetical protein
VQRFFAPTGAAAFAVANGSKLSESDIHKDSSEAESADCPVEEFGQPCSV